MIEGMAAVVQRGIDEILSLRASNKQLLEALRLIEQTLKDWKEKPYGVSADGILNLLIGICDETIRKAEEQA